MTSPAPMPKIAILIVNGGLTKADNRWIRLCLSKITAHTSTPDYQIYLWNNRTNDIALVNWLKAQPKLTYLAAASYETLIHPHRIPLQRLYHLAREEGAQYIVTLDSDAHPLCDSWLTDLIEALEGGAVLAGVWRDELKDQIEPYVHPCCLATTVAFIEQNHLHLDYFAPLEIRSKTDTLSYLTTFAQAAGMPIHRLVRSNLNNPHRLLSGVYADAIYHHAAGSRDRFVFRGDNLSSSQMHLTARTKSALADFLFNDYDRFIGWLRGQPTDPGFAEQILAVQQKNQAQSHPASGPRSLKERLSILLNTRHIQDYLRSWLKKLPGLRRIAQNLRERQHKKRFLQGRYKLYRPTQTEDLHALPSGWRVTGPAYIGVGAPKCGTTWWHELIASHPQVVKNRSYWGSKELQYFPHFQSRPLTAAEIDQYQQIFAAPPGAICGEFSVQYLGYPNCLEQMASAAPDAKILVMLRNPIDRLLSHYNQLCYRRVDWLAGLPADRKSLVQKYSYYSEAALHSFYANSLRRIYRLYDPSQVLVLQYERCCQNPAAELARTYRFLGLHADFLPPYLEARVNSLPYILPKFTRQERANLTAYFAEDVRQTMELCPDFDINLWPDFVQPELEK